MTTQSKKIAVFDFGGVIFKTSATEMYRDLFLQEGRSEEDVDYFLKNIFTKAARSAANTGTMADVTKKLAAEHPAWARYIEAFNADRDFIKQVRGTLPGMPETLKELSAQGFELYGLTNWAADTFESLKGAYPELMGLFNKIVVSGAVGIKKPNAEIFKLAQQEFGNPATGNVHYFDDKPSNTEAAAKAVGWNGVTFENARTVRDALEL